MQLALIEKAKRVFAVEPDVELCFPLLSPLTFTAAEIRGLANPVTATDYAVSADFARVVNLLPHGLVATASELMLWDIYRNVLDRADVASKSQDSSSDGSDASVLYETALDGSRTESEALKRYRQYRDAWFVAREDYGVHKLSGEMSDDPVVRQRWVEVEELALRATLDAAAADWEAIGERSLIERALSAERTAALREPAARWAEWQNAFNPDVDLVTDSGGNQYAPTGLSPRNFADQGEWPRFELSAAEMRSLVATAPDELKSVLGNAIGGQIQRMSFEYRSVALVRPWFHSEALTSCIWRSSNPDLMLSDGADPPNGICPSYPSACVFIRNVVVMGNGASTTTAVPRLKFTIDPRLFAQRNRLLDPLILTRSQRPLAGVQKLTPLSPASKFTRPFRNLVGNSFSLATLTTTSVSAATTARRAAKLRGHASTEVSNVPSRQWEPLSRSAPQSSPDLAPLESGPESDCGELSILAFICKRLPKTPDPAPGIAWS